MRVLAIAGSASGEADNWRVDVCVLAQRLAAAALGECKVPWAAASGRARAHLERLNDRVCRRGQEVYRSAFRYCRGVRPINRWNILLKWLWCANPDRRLTSVSDSARFPSSACARSTRFLSTY